MKIPCLFVFVHQITAGQPNDRPTIRLSLHEYDIHTILLFIIKAHTTHTRTGPLQKKKHLSCPRAFLTNQNITHYSLIYRFVCIAKRNRTENQTHRRALRLFQLHFETNTILAAANVIPMCSVYTRESVKIAAQ